MSAVNALEKNPKGNHIGLVLADYKGGKSTLCGGCGHDVITRCIIRAYFEMGVQPEMVAKVSGIGCSSKTPNYFLSRAHGFNSLHGRMPSVTTGAAVANRNLSCIGVSGDGDSASIGMGQFVHAIRRNVRMVYVVENNGVYGLTKGQFSATADRGSKLKTGIVNELPAIDLCSLALELGATFVARSFAGDTKQLTTILKAAIAHRGAAIVDVVSPCVTFNDHAGSSKSYDYTKEHQLPLHQIDFIPTFDHPEVEQAPGDSTEVELYDGSTIVFRALDANHDPRDRAAGQARLAAARAAEEVVTGIIHVDPDEPDLVDRLDMVDTPLVELDDECLRPPASALEEINRQFGRRS